jgi:hypothetical protein
MIFLFSCFLCLGFVEFVGSMEKFLPFFSSNLFFFPLVFSPFWRTHIICMWNCLKVSQVLLMLFITFKVFFFLCSILDSFCYVLSLLNFSSVMSNLLFIPSTFSSQTL